MIYTYPQKVMFKHCDPAGIVFYPRYFEMLNDCVECFFNDALKLPFSVLHQRGGVPTVQLTTRFKAPSRLGDVLTIRLCLTKIGRTSLGLTFVVECAGQIRLEAESVIVQVDAAGKPKPWPQDVRNKMQTYQKDSDDDQ